MGFLLKYVVAKISLDRAHGLLVSKNTNMLTEGKLITATRIAEQHPRGSLVRSCKLPFDFLLTRLSAPGYPKM